MSRGIVVGVNWYEGDERNERIAAGPDSKLRATLDKLVAGVPQELRKDVAIYLAPLLENNEPPPWSDFRYGAKRSFYVWWKRAYVEEGA